MISGGGLALDEADIRSEGTALSALSTTSPDGFILNLEPPEHTAKRAKSDRDRKVAFSSVALIASLAFAGWAFWTHSAAQKVVATAQAQSAINLTKWDQKTKDVDTLLKRAVVTQKTITNAFQPAQSMSDMITEIANQVNADIWLTGVTAERGKPFQIRGTARNSDAVHSYLNRLKKVDRLRDVQLVFANTGDIDQTPVVNFSLAAFPIGNLPLLDSTKKPS